MGEVVNVGQEFLNRFKIPKTCWEGKISYEQAQMFEKEKVAELEYVQSVLPRLPGAQLEVLLMSPAATEPIRAFIPRTDFAPWDWWLNQIKECPEKYFWHFFYSPVVIAADGQRYLNALVIDVDDIKLEPVEYFWKLIPAESEKVDFDILKIEYFTKGKPLPSFMVWTGGGAHLYFLLDRVYPVWENLSKIKTIYRFLSRVYNGDTGAGFSQRYMRRVPGSWNSKPKYEVPRLSEVYPLESSDSRVRYSIEDLCRIAVRHVGSLVVDDDNPDDEEQLFVANSIDIDYERKRFLGMLKRDRTLRSIYNGTSKELKPNHSASERSFVFAFALLSRGFSKEFTEQMLLEWKYGIVYSSNKYVKRYGTLSAKDRKDCKRRIKLFVKKAEEKINVHSVVLTYMQPGKKYSAPALYRKLSRFMKIKYNRFQKILSSMRKLGVVEAVLEPGRRRKRAKVYYVRRKDYFL